MQLADALRASSSVNAPVRSTPALLTSTSIGPSASMRATSGSMRRGVGEVGRVRLAAELGREPGDRVARARDEHDPCAAPRDACRDGLADATCEAPVTTTRDPESCMHGMFALPERSDRGRA